MKKIRLLQSVFVLLMMGLLGALPVQAQTVNAKAIDAVGGNSLAKHHIVLQETDSDLQRQGLVLNVASNLLQAYGDNADIEIVAFGPGISLLFANNEHAKRIESLAQQGVRFSACMNALKNATQRLGYEPKLNPVAKKVPAGIVRVIDLVDAGYILVRP
jgi:intracellular sulfur oxidation DsrE/DsrF family protein